MHQNKPMIEQIQRKLCVDVSSKNVRRRAWRRIKVFREIADNCEEDGNTRMANVLRNICKKATDPLNDESLIYLAILAGPEEPESPECVVRSHQQ